MTSVFHLRHTSRRIIQHFEVFLTETEKKYTAYSFKGYKHSVYCEHLQSSGALVSISLVLLVSANNTWFLQLQLNEFHNFFLKY